MRNFINKVYKENTDREITKRQVRELVFILNEKCEIEEEDLKDIYNRCGLSGLLLLAELKKFELNLNNL